MNVRDRLLTSCRLKSFHDRILNPSIPFIKMVSLQETFELVIETKEPFSSTLMLID